MYKDGLPQVNLSLNESQILTARNTLELTGLDRVPSQNDKDRRWLKRNQALSKAEEARTDLIEHSNDAMRRQIIKIAVATGFWSVWMTVFQDDTDMRRLLIVAFQGTSTDCFDPDTQPLPRTGGKI